MSKLEVGDRVLIFEDPLTQARPEGWATLKKFSYMGGLHEHWEVEFDNAPGTTWVRKVVPCKHMSLSNRLVTMGSQAVVQTYCNHCGKMVKERRAH